MLRDLARYLACTWPLTVVSCVCLVMGCEYLFASDRLQPVTHDQMGKVFVFLVMVCGVTSVSIGLLLSKLHEYEQRMARLEDEARRRDAAPRDERIVRLDNK